MPNQIVHLISLILAPVVLISACGLLCLTFYNRMAILTARIRSFNAERFELLEKLHQQPPPTATDDKPVHAPQARLQSLEKQTAAILYRARLIRSTLMCLVSCIIGKLLCSLTLGLGLIIPHLDLAALAFFTIVMIVMLVAMFMALMELKLSLQPVSLEQDLLLQINPISGGASHNKN